MNTLTVNITQARPRSWAARLAAEAALAALAALALAFAAAPPQARAAVVVYTSEADYLAAVGSTQTYIDFAGSPAAVVSGASFAPAVTFGSCTDSAAPATCGTSVLHNSGGITDLGGSAAPNGVASLAWRFNEPDIFAFAFHYVSGAIQAVALVEPGTLGVSLVDTTSASGFIGLVSDTAFYGGIGVNAVFGGGIGNDRYFIDDFRINAPAATVPEPSALVLVMLALAAGLGARMAGLQVRARRRQGEYKP